MHPTLKTNFVSSLKFLGFQNRQTLTLELSNKAIKYNVYYYLCAFVKRMFHFFHRIYEALQFFSINKNMVYSLFSGSLSEKAMTNILGL